MPVDSLLSCAGGGDMTSVWCSFIVSSLAFAAAILPATGAESLTIADSFLPGDSYRMSSASVIGFATEFEWEQGSQFVAPGAQPLQVESIQIAAGQAKPDTDVIDIALMTDIGDAPGIVLETISFTVTATDLAGGLLVAQSTTNPVLDPGAKYWIVASAPGVTIPGDWLAWNHSDEPFGRLHAFRQDGGAWQVGTDRSAHAFRVSGTSVPEPGVAVLYSLGGACLAVFARRRGAVCVEAVIPE